jgi:hypothetical protein
LHCIHHQFPDDPLLQVLDELPTVVVNGTKHTVDDFPQELKCSINIKHMFKFLSHLICYWPWFQLLETLVIGLFEYLTIP